MLLPSLIAGTLVKRYKRFLADVLLDNGSEVTVPCPNSGTGSMKGCAVSGSRVFLSRSPNPARKYPFSWELVQADGAVAGNCVKVHI